MSQFSQMRDMYRLQREAKKVKSELAKVHIEAEGKWCKVTVTAEQEIVSYEIKEGAPLTELPADLKDVTNRAMKKAQVVAAERMQSVMKQMGLAMPEGGAAA